MTNPTKVEQVARAICDADPFAPASDAAIMWQGKQCRAWESRVPMARAAIEAMREPTEAMLGDETDIAVGCCSIRDHEKREVWQAMITTALEEE